MWWLGEDSMAESIKTPDFLNIETNKGDNKHGRFICSDDGGNILTLYARYFSFHKTRLFQAINLFQCDKCFQFYAMENGTHNLIPLLIIRKNNDSITVEKEIHEMYKLLVEMKKKKKVK